MGRVVITHSTYVEGLIPVLKVLAQDEGIDTITPAVISRVKGHSPRLRLRVSVPINGGTSCWPAAAAPPRKCSC